MVFELGKVEPILNYKAYRYVDRYYASGNEEWGFRTVLKVELQTFDVLKETPHGFWIKVYPYMMREKRFVRLDARRKFACLTKAEALESYIARKRNQIRILESQLIFAKEGLSIAKMKERAET